MKKTPTLSHSFRARATLRQIVSRAARRAWPLAATCVAATWLAACTMPYHSDASAPAPDPFNPAATQLLDDSRWQLTEWRHANGTVAHTVPQAPAGEANGAGVANGAGSTNANGTGVGANGSTNGGPGGASSPTATVNVNDARLNVKTIVLNNANGVDITNRANDANNAITLDLSTTSGQRRASGFSGCNRYTGTYTLKNGLLSFGPLAGTRMACLGAGNDIERAYLDALAHIARSGVQMRAPQQLLLVLDNGDRLVFARRQ